jgi:hypothetical protein
MLAGLSRRASSTAGLASAVGLSCLRGKATWPEGDELGVNRWIVHGHKHHG